MDSTTRIGDSGDQAAYESTYRRSEFAIPAALSVLVAFIAGLFGIFRFVDGRNLETAVFSLAGGVLPALGLVLLMTFRVHRWTLEKDGIAISERPKVPLMGLSRDSTVRFSEIAALSNVESGLDYIIEITTRHGRRFRLSQAMVGNARSVARPDPDARLGDFAASIRAAAERAGHSLPSMSEGLSFWNSTFGLMLLSVMFVLSLLISGAVVWALFEGMTTTPRPRSGEALAILLLLPVGAGYLLIRSWRRRTVVRTAGAARF